MSRIPMFATKFTQGKRTFFFEIFRSTLHGTLRLKITTVTETEKRKERSQMTLNDSELQDFQQAVAEATSFIVNA